MERLRELLEKFGLDETLIQLLSEMKKFEEAFKVAQRKVLHKIPDIHLMQAMHLEDENKFKEAERHYIEAGKGGQAIQMYINIGDFQQAINLAKQYQPE